MSNNQSLSPTNSPNIAVERLIVFVHVAVKAGFVRLKPEDTKTGEGRSIPLHQILTKMLQEVKVRFLNHDFVFTRDGEPINALGSFKENFRKACQKAGIEDFRFHDLRHVAINNWRKAGHDYFKIMKATGHKTMAVFKRYNTVDEEELKSLTMDTYMDTSKERQGIPSA